MLLGGASLLEAPIRSIVHSNWYAKVQLFWLLFMAVTFDDMTIKHRIYTPKVPFQCTEKACVGCFQF